MRQSTCCFALLLFAMGATATAAGLVIPDKKLDAYFDALAADKLANGSIAISVNGELRYQRSVGFSTITNGKFKPADAGTRYGIDAVSELFTAVLAMQLVDSAAITLGSPLAKFYPDVPNAPDITYRDLLTHYSGLADYTKLKDFDAWRTAPRTQGEMLKLITVAGTKARPREQNGESSSNYLLLGYMLEKIYEKSYDDILRQKIVVPIGLAHTYFAGTANAALERRSYDLTLSGWTERPETDASILGGAGAIVSSPGDLVRFMDALFAGRLVTAYSLASMSNQDDSFGMGLEQHEFAGQTGYGRAGRIAGPRACAYHFPKHKLSIAYTTNAPVFWASDVVDDVLLTIFDGSHEPSVFAPLKLTTRKQAPYLGKWRSADGRPTLGNPFRQFKTPPSPILFELSAGAEAPVMHYQGRPFELKVSGRDMFFVRELGYFLEINSRTGELVMLGPDHEYFLRRAK